MKPKDVSLVTGFFTLEDDEIIREHVAIFGDEKSKDLWLVLGCELNRYYKRVKERWMTIRNDKGIKHSESWTTSMVCIFFSF